MIKGVQGHPRVANERDFLTRFQHSTTHLRPLIEEIQEPAEPPIIILKHLDDHLLNFSVKKALNREELKYVARCMLDALSVIHKEGYVHTGKLFRILIGHSTDNFGLQMWSLTMSLSITRMATTGSSQVQLGDLGGCDTADSEFARSGTPCWSSYVVEPWSNHGNAIEHSNRYLVVWGRGKSGRYSIQGTGLTLCCSWLAWYIGGALIFPATCDSLWPRIIQSRSAGATVPLFWPLPSEVRGNCKHRNWHAILLLMHEIPQSQTTPFSRTTEGEVSLKDKEFISGMMKLDWRDRPTAQQLLESKWFEDWLISPGVNPLHGC